MKNIVIMNGSGCYMLDRTDVPYIIR